MHRTLTNVHYPPCEKFRFEHEFYYRCGIQHLIKKLDNYQHL